MEPMIRLDNVCTPGELEAMLRGDGSRFARVVVELDGNTAEFLGCDQVHLVAYCDPASRDETVRTLARVLGEAGMHGTVTVDGGRSVT